MAAIVTSVDRDKSDDSPSRSHTPLIGGYTALARQHQYASALAGAMRGSVIPQPSIASRSDADAREIVLSDPVVAQCDALYRRQVAGQDWSVVPSRDPDDWAEVWLAQLCSEALEAIPHFAEVRCKLASATLVGSAYAYVEIGERFCGGVTWQVIERLVDIDYRTVRWVARAGRPIRQWSYELREDGALYPTSTFHDIPEDWPLISVVYGDEQARLGYGRGKIEALYAPVFHKQTLLELLLSGVDSVTGGYMLAALDGLRASSAGNEEQALQYLSWLQSIRGAKVGVYDKLDEVRIESVGDAGIDTILAVIRYLDDIIRSLYLGSSMPFGGGSAGSAGSYARSRTEADTSASLIDYDRDWLAEEITQQIVWLWCGLNASALRAIGVPADTPWPVYRPGHVGTSPRHEIEIIERAARMGLPLSLAVVYERLGLPAPKPGEEILSPPTLSNGFGMGSGFGVGSGLGSASGLGSE